MNQNVALYSILIVIWILPVILFFNEMVILTVRLTFLRESHGTREANKTFGKEPSIFSPFS